MITSVSWQQYITAVLCTTILYYAFVILRYYRPEINAFLTKKPQQLATPAIATSPSVIGSVRPEQGQSVIDLEALAFAPDTDEAMADDVHEKDMERETAELAEAFRDIDDKPQFLNLLSILIKKYQPFSNEFKLSVPLKKVWLAYGDQLPFQLTPEDMPAEW